MPQNGDGSFDFAGENHRRQNETRANQRRRKMDASYKTLKSQGVAGPMGAFAWFYLTDAQREEYATWKGSAASGDQYIGGGGSKAPANWLLLDRGSVRGTVTDKDVGYVGIGYLAAAMEHMRSNGIKHAWETWAASRGNKTAAEAKVL